MRTRLEFTVRFDNGGRGETVFAESHQDAAESFLRRIARRDLNSRGYRPHVLRDGVSDSGVHW